MTEKVQTLDFFPFAYALYTEYLDSYCWNCLGECKNLKICNDCKVAWYCSQECITTGWKDHKNECKAFQKNKYIPDIEIRLLGRIVTRYSDILNEKDKEDENFYFNRKSERKIMDIWAHVVEIKKDSHAMNKFEEIYKELVEFYGKENLLNKDVIFELHCRDFINRHAISDRHYLREIGKGLYLDLCAYDHSCSPNTIYVCNGLKATLCPLNSKVNITDKKTTYYSYIDLVVAKFERQKLLRDTWYFDCQCFRCIDDYENILTSIYCPNCTDNDKEIISLFSNNLKRNPETQQIICPKCKNVITQKDISSALSSMRFIKDLLEKKELEQMGIKIARQYIKELIERFKKSLTKYNIYYCKLIEALIKMMNPDEHEEIVELYKAVVPCVKICFPDNHPALAFHLRNIGIELYRLEKFEEAIEYLQKAYDMFKFVMPEGHPLEHSSKAILSAVKIKYEQNSKTKNNDKESDTVENVDKNEKDIEIKEIEKKKQENDSESHKDNKNDDEKPKITEALVEDKNLENVVDPEIKSQSKTDKSDLIIDTSTKTDNHTIKPNVWKSKEINTSQNEPSPQQLNNENVEINTTEIRQRIARVFLDEEEELPELLE